MRLRREFAVTNATRISVREDLYGHVVGWTIREGDRCRTVSPDSAGAAMTPHARQSRAACQLLRDAVLLSEAGCPSEAVASAARGAELISQTVEGLDRELAERRRRITPPAPTRPGPHPGAGPR